jgi:hypothetical protein
MPGPSSYLVEYPKVEAIGCNIPVASSIGTNGHDIVI